MSILGEIEAVSTGRKIKVLLDRRKSGHITISTPSLIFPQKVGGIGNVFIEDFLTELE